MPTPLRTAILGCGGIAARHANLLMTLDDIKLVAFCDSAPERARQFNERFAHGQAQVYEEHSRLFAETDLDLIYICLPPYAHSDEVIQAAAHGVHMLVEKPIALSHDQAWRMVAAVEQAGVKSQVGFMYRFGAAVQQLKTALVNGEAGQPTMMLCRYLCNSLHSEWWRDRSKSGGQVVEQAIHLFDLLRFLLGEPETVFCRTANLLHRDTPGYTVEDVSSTVVTFANGAIGTVAATNTAIPRRWLETFSVVTQNRVVEFQNANHATFTLTDRPGETTLTIASNIDVYLAETLDLLQAIRSGGPTVTPIAEGARTLDLVLAADRSAATGQMVAVEPVLVAA